MAFTPNLGVDIANDTNGTALEINRPNSLNRETSVYVWATTTFAGTSVKLQVTPNGGETSPDWFDVSGATWTSDGVKELAASTTHYRLVTTGGTASTDINGHIF